MTTREVALTQRQHIQTSLLWNPDLCKQIQEEKTVPECLLGFFPNLSYPVLKSILDELQQWVQEVREFAEDSL